MSLTPDLHQTDSFRAPTRLLTARLANGLVQGTMNYAWWYSHGKDLVEFLSVADPLSQKEAIVGGSCGSS